MYNVRYFCNFSQPRRMTQCNPHSILPIRSNTVSGACSLRITTPMALTKFRLDRKPWHCGSAISPHSLEYHVGHVEKPTEIVLLAHT